jgi:hypothetical protein
MWRKIISGYDKNKVKTPQQWVDLIIEFHKGTGRFPKHRESYRGEKVGIACKHFRQDHKHNRLSRNIIDQLNAIGFPWQINSSPKTDQQWADLIVEFHKEMGRSPGQDETYQNENIGSACGTIRQAYKRGRLEQNIIDQLNAIGFPWQINSSPKTPQQWVDLIVEFHKETGRSPKHGETYKGEKVGTACHHLRQDHKQGRLAQDIIAQLDAVGFPWDATKEKDHRRHLAPAKSTGRKTPVVPRAPARYARRERLLERFIVLLEGDGTFETDPANVSGPRGYEGGRTKHDVTVIKNEDPLDQVILHGLYANIRDLGKCVTSVTNYDRKPRGRAARPAGPARSQDMRALTFNDLLDSADKIFDLLIEEDKLLLLEKLFRIQHDLTDLDKVREVVLLLKRLQKEYNRYRLNAYEQLIKNNYKDTIVSLVEKHKDDPSRRSAGLQVLSSWDIVVNDLTEQEFRNMIDSLVKGQQQVFPDKRLKGRFVKVIRQLRLGLQEHSAEGKALEMTITKETEELLAQGHLEGE